MKLTKMSVRWAFKVSNWEPTKAEILLATSCIQQEEKDRLGRFVFKNDFKSSLIGRLMMRKYVALHSSVPYDTIHFKRDDKGKPFLDAKFVPKLSFNVSHQGNYVVLAGELNGTKLGVDVMKLEYGGGKNLSEFFRIMNRNFSANEWETIKNCCSEKSQIAMFCRHWCLKESYVKAIGVGITINLQDVSFKIKSPILKTDLVTNDTELYVKGAKQDWEFHETLLDEEHCIAVAFNSFNNTTVEFKELTINDLLKDAKPLLIADENYADLFFKKLEKN